MLSFISIKGPCSREGKVLSKLDPKVAPDVPQRLKPRQVNSTDLRKEG